ncbi:SDR family NAD(P)-dependent oxidoreductase [Nitrospirillum amazonense]|uniref:NAD(P)-dependent dehydrogenase (Short-subunit alcohol dehydrogenase family) n=1 Tax=Nitrospirillum amazonense TaxID=28077 RepID=A0A560JWW2_9PROT|nr:SDR family NAD(P)-dependent oxidoreductase [Nitrospirillum amazonense]MDG3440464.1 SDR family NAD(P)-dependent oxidoreductase [Nitrospirillum amazonense]TWB75199.1 NAD(P)-dependent dehydrogenase (short-subunit alcohol dehydrogenase family) [Nitrospirillum amazonense]
MSASPTAFIVGASRGLGLALAQEYLTRGWQVIATVRPGAEPGPLHELAGEAQGRLTVETVDIVHADQIAALRRRLEGSRVDVLFVNAGVTNNPEETIGGVSTEEFVRIQVTNALAPMRCVEVLGQLVTPKGTIAVMSSGLGSVANNLSGGWEVYRASKAALNTLMRSYAARQPAHGRTLLVIAPGWVRTDMGGPAASLDVSESIPRVVDVVTAQAGKPGLQYLDYTGATVPW